MGMLKLPTVFERGNDNENNNKKASKYPLVGGISIGKRYDLAFELCVPWIGQTNGNPDRNPLTLTDTDNYQHTRAHSHGHPGRVTNPHHDSDADRSICHYFGDAV